MRHAVLFILLSCLAQFLSLSFSQLTTPNSDNSYSYGSHSQPSLTEPLNHNCIPFTMISDNDLYRLAIFLGSCAMMMIVLYHFLEINAQDDDETEKSGAAKNSRVGAGSNNGAKGNGGNDMVITGNGVPLAAAAAEAGGSAAIGGGKGR